MITWSTPRFTSSRSTGASFMKFGRAPTTERTRIALLHRDALREIARPIHVTAAQDGDVIRQELQRNHRQDRRQEGRGSRYHDLVISEMPEVVRPLARDRDDAPAAGLHLLHCRHDLRVDRVPRRQTD